MSINAFEAAVAGESVLVTETRMEELQLLVESAARRW